MKLGISLPTFSEDPARPLEVAARAEVLGFDGVFVPDHFFPPAVYPRSGPEQPSLEAFSLLAAVAALNPGLRVGTLVARVTLRAPGLLAKQAAGLDAISAGRAILGLGAGDAASLPEHEMFGIPFPPAADRLAMLEETASAARVLFAGGSWPGGTHVPAMSGPLLPPGSPEIWIGGLSDAAIGVAARVGDAWNGWGLDATGFAAKVKVLRERARGREIHPTWGGIVLVGEDDAELENLRAARHRRGLSDDGVWAGTAAQLRTFAGGLERAGASWLVALPAGPADRIDVIAEALGDP